MPIVGRSAEQLIADYEAHMNEAAPPSVRAFFHALAEFVEGDGPEADARRNKKFKLIPNIPQAGQGRG